LSEAVLVPRHRRLRALALVVLGCFAIAIFPWTGYLASTLPEEHRAQHWDVLWAGFDVGVGLAAIATLVAVARHQRWLVMAGSVLGTLLVCDAWFDVVTSIGTRDLRWALVEAVCGELPLAVLCFWLARDAFELAGSDETRG
jgi:hypothetical protein